MLVEPKLAIRKADRGDAQRIWDIRVAAIRAQCRGFYGEEVLEAWTKGDLSDQFVAWVESSFYVAIDGDAIVGTGAIDIESGQIDAVFIRPEYMGHGIARTMMAHLEGLAVSTELKVVSLSSTLNAAPFYRKCGFIGETIGIYESPRGFTLDCILMTKILCRNPPHAQHCGAPDALTGASDL